MVPRILEKNILILVGRFFFVVVPPTWLSMNESAKFCKRVYLLLGAVSLVCLTELTIFFISKRSLSSVASHNLGILQPWSHDGARGAILDQTRGNSTLGRLQSIEEKVLALSPVPYRPFPEAKAPFVDYRIDRFQVSPKSKRTALTLNSFKFTPAGAVNSTKIAERDGCDDEVSSIENGALCCRDLKLVCKLRSLSEHFAHFIIEAYACWSLLRRFPHAEKYLDVDHPRRITPFNGELLDVIKREVNATILSLKKGAPEVESSPTAWIAEQKFQDPNPEWKKGKPVLGLIHYFMSRADVSALQKAVLGDTFEVGPPLNYDKIRLLLLDRKGSTRSWPRSNETLSRISHEWNDVLDARRVASLNSSMSLRQQAAEMHKSDIIISPHGGQLSNLAFIRPCTAVVELFPENYYLGFYQPLVMIAGAISFEGYLFDRDPLADMIVTNQKDLRAEMRKPPMQISAESIVRALPEIIHEVLRCRMRHVLESNS